MDHSKSSNNKETQLSNWISHHAAKFTQSFMSHYSNGTKSPIDLTKNNLHGNPKMLKLTWNGRFKKS